MILLAGFYAQPQKIEVHRAPKSKEVSIAYRGYIYEYKLPTTQHIVLEQLSVSPPPTCRHLRVGYHTDMIPHTRTQPYQWAEPRSFHISQQQPFKPSQWSMLCIV